jgi:DNA repair protein RadC
MTHVTQLKLVEREPGPGLLPAWRLEIVRDPGIQWNARSCITGPADVYAIARQIIGSADREQILVILVDTKNRPIATTIAATGTINACSTTAREVFKAAVVGNASAIIMAHNHPSGDPAPSSEDIKLTRDMMTAGQLLDIALLDHIVVGATEYRSLRELGFMSPEPRELELTVAA